MAHYDIFRHHLVIKFPAYGHALWDPEPGRLYPSSVEIGDVGYIREGKFHRLFNALLPADHPSHRNFGVPEYHEQLTLNMENHINNCKLSPNNFCSSKVSAIPVSERWAEGPNEIPKVTFSCPMKEGAVLSLPIQAKGENTVAMADFGKWMIKHIDCWSAWVRQLGLGVNRMENIILVTGTHRTRSWTNVAFPGGQVDAQATFGAKVDHSGDVVAINWKFSHELNRGAVLNCGPDGKDLPEDQCIFVRGFRVSRKLKILPPRLKGAAEPNPDKEGQDEESDVELIPIPSVPEYRDPLHVLLEYIAESDMVLVHDNDLARLHEMCHGTLLGSLQPDAMLSLLRSSQLRIHETPFDTDLSSADNRTSTDTETMSIATLSNLFEEPPLDHDSELRRWSANSGTSSLLQRMAVSPVTAYPNTRTTLLNMYSNIQDNSTHHPRARSSGARQSDGQSGQGERGGQPSYMDVDSTFTLHYPGSGVVNSPAYYSQRNQGGVTFHLSQITEPHPHVPHVLNPRSPVATTDTHRHNHAPVSGSFGPYSSNPSAGYIPPPTPASLTTQLRQGVPYGAGATGNTGPSSYFPADSTRPSTATSRTGGGASRGHDPQRYASSAAASSSGPTPSSISNAHQSQSRPRCKLPRCEKAAIFDRSINEQREFCEDHIGHVIPVGFVGRCVTCGKMSARLDSEFCSDACRNMSAQMASSSGNAGRQQQQPTPTSRQTAPPMQRVVSSGGASGAAVGVPSRRPAESSVPEGLGPTCQECRRPITKEARFGSHFCSRNCEEANRKYSNSSKSRR